MKAYLPFAAIVGIGMFSVTYVVDPGQYSCRWTIIGYICPAIEVSAR